MIYDGFIFRDELDLIEMRLKFLWDEVDVFVLVESNKTFKGDPKPYHFEENRERFKEWESKIRYVKIDPDISHLDLSKNDSSYTPTSPAWQVEYMQRNAIAQGFHDAKENDMLMVSDVDEFPDMSLIKEIKDGVFNMPVYYYYVNMKANKGFGETIVTTRFCIGKVFRDKYKSLPQNMRFTRRDRDVKRVNGGWHFSFLGGKEVIRKKIKSFSHTEYNSEKYFSDENIDQSIDTGKDIFNRGIKYLTVNPKEDLPEDLYTVVSSYPKFIKNG
jgi:beta-1,4-mannosyl-glycoprotein beta-1,4-N-acetylglucosaminyltransferase